LTLVDNPATMACPGDLMQWLCPGRLLHVPGSWDPEAAYRPLSLALHSRCTASSVTAARTVPYAGSRLQLLLHLKCMLVAVGGKSV
jgi:hypothetical protein